DRLAELRAVDDQVVHAAVEVHREGGDEAAVDHGGGPGVGGVAGQLGGERGRPARRHGHRVVAGRAEDRQVLAVGVDVEDFHAHEGDGAGAGLGHGEARQVHGDRGPEGVEVHHVAGRRVAGVDLDKVERVV